MAEYLSKIAVVQFIQAHHLRRPQHGKVIIFDGQHQPFQVWKVSGHVYDVPQLTPQIPHEGWYDARAKEIHIDYLPPVMRQKPRVERLALDQSASRSYEEAFVNEKLHDFRLRKGLGWVSTVRSSTVSFAMIPVPNIYVHRSFLVKECEVENLIL
ncbi:hypothetical protein KC332_g2815 [Hortaea werneckii]|nr:hypothetical protein KC358_g2680 [Hortaea werneckii]KAI6850104.1 hypothetical protein KC350_g2279 [Hortaea werneckii]KAI6941986.1 hypothetical protein KC341_g2540 [Hortaea werneckii]KAI6946826.1 hypothetical protein KC348_g2877 [Hortaea werneckii]KAI6972855.1 hypothetical protein KC321_g6002 [Hortaea werneckii]